MFGSKDARKNYRDAKAALDENAEKEKKAGIREETPKYQRLNKNVNDALDELKASKKRR